MNDVAEDCVANRDAGERNVVGNKAIAGVSRRLPSSGRWSARVALAVLLTGMLSSGAWAQSGLMPNAPPGVGNIATGRRSETAPEKPAIAAPDAIPGAKARGPAAPATRALTDMAPNDALFDAINRGDIAAARDSISRGADLDAVNILGMTPMELSVDLGRNDISFLLLSMRGEDSGRGARSVGRDTAAASPAPAAMASAKPTRSKSSRPTKTASVATKPVGAPKLFANDGGTPLPSAGFLGFDSRPATN